MATTAWVAAMANKSKYAIRHRNRCRRCGRARSFMRKFQICRICFRNLALQGMVPGVTKSSW
jgi:small subunit ribosomal protein S14